MQISTRHLRNQHGSVLVIGLLITLILGITLASYLYMVQSQNVAVERSRIWNSAIPLSEAGIEDALAMINKYNDKFDLLHTWTNSSSLSSDNFTSLGNNVYTVRRYIGNNFYDVYITNLNNQPSITAIGTVIWNHTYASAAPMMAAVNVNVQSSDTRISRKIAVRTKVDPLINVAMAALRTINLNGKNVMTDSFDSADPNYSTNGLYPAGNINKTKAGGDVVSNDTIIDTLNVGNAKIKGSVKTGPKGTVSIGPNGSVGDRNWVESGSTGIQPGHSADDMNVLFPVPTVPPGTYYYPPSGTVDGVAYSAILDTGNYWLNNIGGAAGINKVLVRGDAKLWMQTGGSINLTGNDVIRITTNASLRIYMGGSTAKFAGNGVVNENGNAASFYYFGLASNTSVDFSGNASVTGVVYAPTADFSLGGGGSDTYDFVGSSVTKTVKMNGHFNFHYDENLRNNNMGRGYIPTDWKEL